MTRPPQARNTMSARVRTWSLPRLHAVGAAAAILMLAGIVAQAPAAAASAGWAARPAQPKLTGAIAPRPPGNGHRQRAVKLPPTVSVGNGPDGLALDPATHTLYSSNQNSDNSVSVINIAHCDAGIQSRLRVSDVHSVSLPAGASPQGIALDVGHRHHLRGQHRRQLDLGDQREDLQRRRLLRLRTGPGQHQGPARADSPGRRSGHRHRLRGQYRRQLLWQEPHRDGNQRRHLQRQAAHRLRPDTADRRVGHGPDGVAVDQATETVYVVNNGPTNNGHTVSVINAATCNGQPAFRLRADRGHDPGRARAVLDRRRPGHPYRLHR